MRSNRRRAKGRSPIAADADAAIASTVAFAPPVPEHLTDEDLLGALRRIPVHYQEVIVLADRALHDITMKGDLDQRAGELHFWRGASLRRLGRNGVSFPVRHQSR